MPTERLCATRWCASRPISHQYLSPPRRLYLYLFLSFRATALGQVHLQGVELKCIDLWLTGNCRITVLFLFVCVCVCAAVACVCLCLMGSEDLVVMVEMLHDSRANQNENGFSNSDIYIYVKIYSILFIPIFLKCTFSHFGRVHQVKKKNRKSKIF